MSDSADSLARLAASIKTWGRELGFQQLAITDLDLSEADARLRSWLALGYQGDMGWLAEHGEKRWRPEQLVPGTLRVITARMDYLPPDTNLVRVLRDPRKAYISRYALGRDYHKLIRRRLARLGERIAEEVPDSLVYRPFVDSAPVLEKPLAEKSGLGWMGKNTLILNRAAGSWFFLGEIYVALPLPADTPEQTNQCGNCSACLTICPTKAFPAPYVLDARRCISYLTIEHQGAIAEELRPLMGNRVFGCDDCQAICPWNRYARPSDETDFRPRHGLADSDLATLFQWTEAEFEDRTAGSPIRRIGYQRWRRNLAVGLGNSGSPHTSVPVLQAARAQATPLVREHIDWALHRLALPEASRPGAARPFPDIIVRDSDPPDSDSPGF